MSNASSDTLSPPPTPRDYSLLGILSLIFFLISILIALILIGMLLLPQIPIDSPLIRAPFEAFICGIGPLSLFGIATGIWSLVRPYKRIRFGVLGIITNVLTMIIYCIAMAFFLLFGFGMIAAAGI